MANEYEQSITIERDPADVFSWVSKVGNLPHYLPPIKEAATEGPAEAGTPGEKVRMTGEIPDRGEFEGEGYLNVLEEQRRMEWGAEVGREYSGWLTVSDAGQAGSGQAGSGRSEVVVHLSFGEASQEPQIQEESSEERDPLEESLGATLESIKRQLEEGSGKEQPPPQIS